MWRSATAQAITATLVLLAACGDAGETEKTERTSSRPEVVGSESELVRFVQRLLDFRYPGAPDPAEVQIFAGQLPEDMPVELPIPRDAEVVGSLARGDQNVEIILDVPGEPKSVLDAYEKRLVAAGWSEPELEGPPGDGFVPADGAFTNVFCQGEKAGPYLSVSAFRLDNGDMSDVRLSLDSGPEDYSPCAQRSLGEPPMAEGLIPRLAAPQDARMREGGGGGGGSGSWYSSSTLETEISVGELGEHYRAQLEAAGWMREGSGASGPAAWSTWTFTDQGDRWGGVFLALDIPEQENTRFLYLRIQRLNGEGVGTSGGSGLFQFAAP